MATGRVPTTANSPLTAKGDLFGYSTTQARVPVGNDGETLVADSSATTGLRWTATPSASNPIINSSFDVWQRGTTFSNGVANTYTADRWSYGRDGNVAGLTVSRQSVSDSTNLPNIQYAARAQRANGNTSTATMFLVYNLETVDSIPFAGKTVTFSYYARAGANFSPTSSQLDVVFQTGTGTDQNLWTSYTGLATVLDTRQAITTTWARYSYTFTISSTATQMGFYFRSQPTGTAGANDWFDVTGVQINIGNTALPYRRNSATLAGEFQAACRYYWRITKNDGIVGHMYKYLSGDGMGFIELPVPMRVTPTSMDILNIQFQQTNLTNNAIFGPTLNTGYSTNKIGAFTFGQTGLASGTQGYAALTSSGYIGFSAEL